METLENLIHMAVHALSRGDVIAIPTETVWGLAADATNEAAVCKIFALKERKADHALPIQVVDIHALEDIADLDNRARAIASAFFPGPLTIVVPQKSGADLAESVNQNSGKIGVRIPDHPLALRVLRAFKKPLAVTSANISGQPPLMSAEEIIKTFGNRLGAVLPGSIDPSGTPSTVVDVTGGDIKILRQGSILREDILKVIS